MAEYRRIVSYLYEYKNGKRGENVGYVRVQRVQEQIKIVLNLKDRKNMEDIPLRIYFYIHKNDNLYGVFVDNIFLHGGNCEYKKSLPEKELFKNGQMMEQMHGMLLYYNRELSYGTEWDDRKIEVEKFVPEGKKGGQDREGKKTESVLKKDGEDRSNRDSKKEISKKKPIKEENGIEDRKKQEIKEEKKKTEQIKPVKEEKKQEIKFLAEKKEMENPETEIQEKIVQLLREKKERMERQKQLEQSKNPSKAGQTQLKSEEGSTIHMQERDEVERMFLEYPKIPNIETEDLNDCVKINPKDITKMNHVNWWLKNNRLLLYRFDQYHHLLLGKRRNQDGSWQRVVGIPGVFDNKERYLASLFQFYSFIPTENKKYRTGSFGYWVTPIK